MTDDERKDTDEFFVRQFKFKDPSEVALDEKLATISAALDVLEELNRKFFSMTSIDVVTAATWYQQNAEIHAKAVRALQQISLDKNIK
jgi:hypothetical protein